MPKKSDTDAPQKRRIKIILEYLGTNYAGWQYQKNALSIQEVVEKTIDKMMKRLSRVTASGRTDAGVHALYQPAHVDVETTIPDETIVKGLNCLLPDDIAVKDVSTVPPGIVVSTSTGAC